MMIFSGKQAIKKIDFGDIDGLYDPKIKEYFLDFNFWDRIVLHDCYYVIGRKGTGKSAIYNWIEQRQYDEGILVSNLSFKEFPFEKFLKLSDDDFSKPNQYQSIWRNIILSEVARLIVLDQKNSIDENYKIIADYVNFFFGTDLTELHKEVTRRAEKTSFGIGLKLKKILRIKANQEWMNGIDIKDGLSNITMINRKLQKVIEDYLKLHNATQIIVQFDQLDDNYTLFLEKEEYFQSIISLFKVVYDINKIFRKHNIKTKIVIYLRSDIYYSINSFDAESARWEQNKLDLNYAIVTRSDWHNSKLLKIINRRIINSLPELREERNPFQVIFDNRILNLKEGNRREDPFRYIIHRTLHRPRDLIQFCIKIQEEVFSTDNFYFRTIKDAEKEYSLWFLGEIENELGPRINDLKALYELLRLMGRSPYSLTEFKNRYKRYKNSLKIEAEELLRLLYQFGIIYNINLRGKYTEIFSIIRNDRSVFNRDLKIVTHKGFYQGLHTSKFSKRTSGST